MTSPVGVAERVITTVSGPVIATDAIVAAAPPAVTSNPRPLAHSVCALWWFGARVSSQAIGGFGTSKVTVMTAPTRVALFGWSGFQSLPWLTT